MRASTAARAGLFTCALIAAGGLGLTACNSGDPPATEQEARPTLPDELPADPFEALDVLLEAPYSAHYDDPAQTAAASRRITDAIDAAARASDDPPRFVALQAAGAVLTGNPTAGSFAAVRREWRSLRSRQ